MIKFLDGMHETPDYRENTHLCIYKNNKTESYPPHWHFPIEFMMPIKNSYTIVADDKEYVVEPNGILYVGSGVIHSTIAPSMGERYFFQIDISRLKSISGINHILSFMGPVALFTPETYPDIHAELVKLFQEICDEYFANGYNDDGDGNECSSTPTAGMGSLFEPLIYAKLLTMLTLIGRNHLVHVDTDSTNSLKKKEYIEKFMSVCRYIDDHFTEDLNLDTVAAMYGFSKFHFSRLFKQFTKISFYKYVNMRRISYAEQLLADPSLSITQIAIRSGFSSSSFIRMFKQIKNCTPTDFRKIHEENSFRKGTPLPKTLQEEALMQEALQQEASNL